MHSADILHQARHMLHDPRDAEEAVQDIFMKIYRGLDDFRGDSTLKTWVHAITRNHCINMRRKQRPEEVSIDDIDADTILAECSESPEEAYDSAEAGELLRDAISSLEDRESEAVSLYCISGMSYHEIAEIMRLPMGTVATIMRRGRIHLYHRLHGRRKDEMR